jgi:hypothetical protein
MIELWDWADVAAVGVVLRHHTPGETLETVAAHCDELARHLRGADSSGGCSGECRPLPLKGTT